MVKVLKHPAIVVDHRMDNGICRITVTDYTIKANIKDSYQKELANDKVWQVAVYGIEDKDFIVLNSLLERLEDELIIDENGNKIS